MISKKFSVSDNLKFNLVSILIGFILGGIILIFAGLNPIVVYRELILGVFSRPRYIMWAIIYSIPIMLTGLSFVFANKTGLFNIGGEGQFIMGALSATIVGYYFRLPFFIHIPLTMIAGILGGLIWGGIVGFLKNSRGINEVISSIMLNWIAFYLSNELINKLPNFKIQNLDASNKINKTAEIGFTSGWIEKFFASEDAFKTYSVAVREFLGTKANFGYIIAILVVLFINYFLFKTKYGYSLRAVGNNKDAAKYAGINVKKAILISMGIAGALSGLAGALHVMGNSNQVTILTMTENYGFDGISVALIGSMSPIGVIFSSLFFGILKYGGTKLSIVNAPSEIVNIIIGFIIYSIAISNGFKLLFNYFKNRGVKNG